MKIKVKTVSPFNDREENVERVKGSVFNVTQERFNEINSTVHGKLIEMIEEDEQDGQDLRFDGKVNKRKTEDKT